MHQSVKSAERLGAFLTCFDLRDCVLELGFQINFCTSVLKILLNQGLTLELWHLRPDNSLSWRPSHCRMFCSTCGLYSLDANSTPTSHPQIVTTTNVSRYYQMSPWGPKSKPIILNHNYVFFYVLYIGKLLSN